MTSEKPILFSAPMIRAILDGRKSQTRRVFKGYTPPNCPGVHSCVIEDGYAKFHLDGQLSMHSGEWTKCPYQVGTKLWVREAFGLDPTTPDKRIKYLYRSSIELRWEKAIKWKPSIFMPRAASRITLEIVGVRVEKLGDITTDDAEAEGAVRWWNSTPLTIGQGRPLLHPKKAFEALWEFANGKGSWAKNPWVWVISFKKL